MKQIKAIVRAENLPRVIQALKDSDVPRFYVSRLQAMGTGADPEGYRISSDGGEAYTEKAALELLCIPEQLRPLLDVITDAAQTGRRGDGLILVSEVSDVISIRTGDHDQVALL